MALKRIAKAVGAGVVAIGMIAAAGFATSMLTAAPAEAAKFYVRNCADVPIYVCSYSQDDNLHRLAKTTKSLQPGDRRTFRCWGDRCKAYIALTDADVKHLVKLIGGALGGVAGMTAASAAGSEAGVTATAVSISLATGVELSVGVELAAAAALNVIDIAVVGGAVFGVVAAVQGLKKQSICGRIRMGLAAANLTRKQKKEIRKATKGRKEKRAEKKKRRKEIGAQEKGTRFGGIGDDLQITGGEYSFAMTLKSASGGAVELSPSLVKGEHCSALTKKQERKARRAERRNENRK